MARGYSTEMDQNYKIKRILHSVKLNKTTNLISKNPTQNYNCNIYVQLNFENYL